MNDPHVVALLYRVEHHESVEYSKAKPLVHDESAFRLEVKDSQARFEFKEHYANKQDAQNAIEYYIRNWEFNACLEKGPDSFRLVFEESEIEDRNPTPGVINLSCDSTLPDFTGSVKLTIGFSNYPAPPSGVNYNDPDVQTMHQRFMGYRQQNEPLASMAYFCLTVLENTMGQNYKPRKAAAQKYQIDEAVLNNIGDLSSEKGGQAARKAVGVDKEFTNEERVFLEKAIERIILRTAEKAHSPDNDLPMITMSDLPAIPVTCENE